MNPTAASRTIVQDRAQRATWAQRPASLARVAPYAVAGLTVIGGALRVMALGSKGLWLDEAFSVWLANQPLGELLVWLLRVDQHPPLYYALLHFWVAIFGDSAASARMPSVVFGTLTIPVIYLLGRRLLGTTGGLLAAAILTVSPFHVRFAQEAHMYTLLTLNASLALFCLTFLLTDQRSASEPIGAQLNRYVFQRALSAWHVVCRSRSSGLRADSHPGRNLPTPPTRYPVDHPPWSKRSLP